MKKVFALVLAAMLLAFFVLSSLRRRYPAEKEEGAERGWKPGMPFYLGTAMCLVITALREFL